MKNGKQKEKISTKDNNERWSLRTSVSNRSDHQTSAGFSLVELIVSSAIMLVVIIGALALYSRSNQISVDQEQYAELQHDVRSAMYLITRDVRMAGAGLPVEFAYYAFQGFNNEDQEAEVTPDRLIVFGNMDNSLSLKIHQYQGSSATVSVYDGSFEQYPYSEEYYQNRVVLILPNPASDCRQGVVRQITHITWSTGGTNEAFNMSPGLAPGINPPGGLTADTDCDPNDYDNGLIISPNNKEIWLDVTGSYGLTHFPGLTAGEKGYVGEPGILYETIDGLHLPLAQNIENLQFEYNGDLDDDGHLDGFKPWDDTWTADQIALIRQIRIIIVGRTPNRFTSVSGKVPANVHNYRRPAVSDSTGSTTDDYHRRFVLETTANVRNLSLNIYNLGER
ncbi:MAG: PilW family protein [Acidobacteriota bacterium]|nr:PilW family protein [Acidobacteriota bacterium]